MFGQKKTFRKENLVKNKTKVESVQLGKILNFSVFPDFPRPRIKC